MVWSEYDAGACDSDFCGFGIGPVGSLVVNPRGSAAWAASGDGMNEVWRVDGSGRRRLARGEDIDPSSLRRRENLIEWRQAGVPRRETLTP